MKSIRELTNQLAQSGRVGQIMVRPQRRATPVVVESVEAIADVGLEGDHYASKGGKRQVTLIAQEHLNAVASMLGKRVIALLARRNIVTQGINLLSLKDKQFKIGDAILEYTGECHPRSRMEENFGPGGYNAMRGHGGITCKVIKSGSINIGDSLTFMG